MVRGNQVVVRVVRVLAGFLVVPSEIFPYAVDERVVEEECRVVGGAGEGRHVSADQGVDVSVVALQALRIGTAELPEAGLFDALGYL